MLRRNDRLPFPTKMMPEWAISWAWVGLTGLFRRCRADLDYL